MDNHSIHKRHSLWLDEHPNVFFHYTPTSASWLNNGGNMVWHPDSLNSLRGASFSSTQELSAQIKAFQEAYNKTAQPFAWKNKKLKARS
jgi:hypothetical protein